MFWKSQKSGILKTEWGHFSPNAKIVFSVTTEKKDHVPLWILFPFPSRFVEYSKFQETVVAIAISMHEKSDKIIEFLWHFMFLKEFEKVWKGIFKYRSMPPSSSSWCSTSKLTLFPLEELPLTQFILSSLI